MHFAIDALRVPRLPPDTWAGFHTPRRRHARRRLRKATTRPSPASVVVVVPTAHTRVCSVRIINLRSPRQRLFVAKKSDPFGRCLVTSLGSELLQRKGL
jgi:hypothetical protein